MAEKTATVITKPSWFSVPESIIADFNTNPNFPKGFIPPTNKVLFGGTMMAWDISDINGKNPLLSCGYTHVDDTTRPMDGAIAPKANAGLLLGDAAWSDVLDGFNSTKWHNDQINNFASIHSLILLDYEHMGDGPQSTGAMRDKMAYFSNECTARGTKLGCWGQGIVNPTPFYEINTSTGALIPAFNSTSRQQWVDMYDLTGSSTYVNANARANPIVTQGGLKISNPFYYHAGYLESSKLYATMAAHEIGKVLNPTLLSIPAIWSQIEHVDGYEIETVDVIKPNGVRFRKYMKMQTPACAMYGDALWSVTVWDGFYHFETGRQAINDLTYCVNEFDQTPLPIKQGRQGINNNVRYPNKYFGFYNYVHLALWQASQAPVKAIIEAPSTSWLMPEFRVASKTIGTAGNTWRTGGQRFPSFNTYYKEPLIRIKYSADGTKVLIVAQNPFNEDYEVVNIRDPSNSWSTTITLEGGWAQMVHITL